MESRINIYEPNDLPRNGKENDFIKLDNTHCIRFKDFIRLSQSFSGALYPTELATLICSAFNNKLNYLFDEVNNCRQYFSVNSVLDLSSVLEQKGFWDKVDIENAIIDDLFNRMGVYNVTHKCWNKSQGVSVDELKRLYPEFADQIKNAPYIEEGFDGSVGCLVSVTGKRLFEYDGNSHEYKDFSGEWKSLGLDNLADIFRNYLKSDVKKELSDESQSFSESINSPIKEEVLEPDIFQNEKDYSFINNLPFSDYAVLKRPSVLDFGDSGYLISLSDKDMFHYVVCSEDGFVLVTKPDGHKVNLDIDSFSPDTIFNLYSDDCIKAELTACQMYDNKIFPLGCVPDLCQGPNCQFDIKNCDYVCIGYPHQYSEEGIHKNWAVYSVIVPKDTFLSVKEQMVKAYSHTSACPYPMQKDDYYSRFEIYEMPDSDIASKMLNYSKDSGDDCMFMYKGDKISFPWKDYIFYDDFMKGKYGQNWKQVNNHKTVKEPCFKKSESNFKSQNKNQSKHVI